MNPLKNYLALSLVLPIALGFAQALAMEDDYKRIVQEMTTSRKACTQVSDMNESEGYVEYLRSKELLELGESSQDKYGNTLLHCEVNGYIHCIDNPRCDMYTGELINQKEVDEKELKIAALLAARKIDINILNEFRETPLHMLARYSDILHGSRACIVIDGVFHRRVDPVIEMFLKEGADPNIKNSHGWTPLYLVAKKSRKPHPELLSRLIIAGARLKKGDDGGADLMGVTKNSANRLFLQKCLEERCLLELSASVAP